MWLVVRTIEGLPRRPRDVRHHPALSSLDVITADGTCAFSEFAATSGAIVNFNLTLVESDDQLEINNASATVREALYEQRPQAFDTIATAILEPLDDRTMATLNARVANGEDPAAVAKDYLSGQGLM